MQGHGRSQHTFSSASRNLPNYCLPALSSSCSSSSSLFTGDWLGGSTIAFDAYFLLLVSLAPIARLIQFAGSACDSSVAAAPSWDVTSNLKFSAMYCLCWNMAWYTTMKWMRMVTSAGLYIGTCVHHLECTSTDPPHENTQGNQIFIFSLKHFALAQCHHCSNRTHSGTNMSAWVSSPRWSYKNVKLGSRLSSKNHFIAHLWG